MERNRPRITGKQRERREKRRNKIINKERGKRPERERAFDRRQSGSTRQPHRRTVQQARTAGHLPRRHHHHDRSTRKKKRGVGDPVSTRPLVDARKEGFARIQGRGKTLPGRHHGYIEFDCQWRLSRYFFEWQERPSGSVYHARQSGGKVPLPKVGTVPLPTLP